MPDHLSRAASGGDEPRRPRPVADELTAPFWAATHRRRLEIQRCTSCARYQFPPEAVCTSCLAGELAWTPVSGRGRLHSYTSTESGVRHPGFATPYLVGLVELEEQPGLFLYSNLPGAELGQLRAGLAVEVVFEELDADVTLPQFRVLTPARELHQEEE